MNMRWPLILIVLVATACNKSKERSSLSDRVDFACGLLKSDLAAAAKKYREYADWMAEGRLSPDQQGRAEIDLRYGTTQRERRLAGHGIEMQLRLCATTRDIDDNRSSDYVTRASKAVAKLTWGTDVLTATEPDPAQTATSVKDLAALAAEINALPIRD